MGRSQSWPDDGVSDPWARCWLPRCGVALEAADAREHEQHLGRLIPVHLPGCLGENFIRRRRDFLQRVAVEARDEAGLRLFLHLV
ncbi:hypothetical protein ACFSHP_09685 [Novosphingobium panipatense]